ncbi:unnamed protein product, partial [Strongylus vulgaris]
MLFTAFAILAIAVASNGISFDYFVNGGQAAGAEETGRTGVASTA